MSTLLLSAGDASGEHHASELVTAYRALEPEARFLGLGGAAMQKAGVALEVHQRELAVGGLVEVARDGRRIVSAWRRMNRALSEQRPDLAILVDSPDFNIPFARRVRRAGVPVLYYISPQVWAWRRGRVRKLARRVDRMAVIFPFEAEFYAGSGLRVDFVGHPLVERLRGMRERASREAAKRTLSLEPRPLVALLPGSRRNEVRDSLPMQLEAARALHALDPRVAFAVAVAPSIARGPIEAAIAGAGLPALMRVDVFEGRGYDVILAADAALAKPGTVTVEIALLETPLVVAARANPVTAAIMRRVVKVPSFTMPNLIAGRNVVPEFLQQDARPEPIANALLDLLYGEAGRQQQADLAEVRRRLGSGGASERVAAIAREMVVGPCGT